MSEIPRGTEPEPKARETFAARRDAVLDAVRRVVRGTQGDA